MDLNQVTVPCTDYAASVRFYKALGLTQIVDSPPRYGRFETPSGGTLSIHAAASIPPDSGIVIYFEVDDVDTTAGELQERGIDFEAPPVDQDWLWREAYLRDPAGNRLCIYHAGRHRRYPPWRVVQARDDSPG
jgi:predicted enzyme related to lactoylglutathione lyase